MEILVTPLYLVTVVTIGDRTIDGVDPTITENPTIGTFVAIMTDSEIGADVASTPAIDGADATTTIKPMINGADWPATLDGMLGIVSDWATTRVVVGDCARGASSITMLAMIVAMFAAASASVVEAAESVRMFFRITRCSSGSMSDAQVDDKWTKASRWRRELTSS